MSIGDWLARHMFSNPSSETVAGGFGSTAGLLGFGSGIASLSDNDGKNQDAVDASEGLAGIGALSGLIGNAVGMGATARHRKDKSSVANGFDYAAKGLGMVGNLGVMASSLGHLSERAGWGNENTAKGFKKWGKLIGGGAGLIGNVADIGRIVTDRITSKGKRSDKNKDMATDIGGTLGSICSNVGTLLGGIDDNEDAAKASKWLTLLGGGISAVSAGIAANRARRAKARAAAAPAAANNQGGAPAVVNPNPTTTSSSSSSSLPPVVPVSDPSASSVAGPSTSSAQPPGGADPSGAPTSPPTAVVPSSTTTTTTTTSATDSPSAQPPGGINPSGAPTSPSAQPPVVVNPSGDPSPSAGTDTTDKHNDDE